LLHSWYVAKLVLMRRTESDFPGTFWSCLTSSISALVDSMSAVWLWMINFRLSMSFHTSLVVIRPVLSDGVKASPLRVPLHDSGYGSLGARGWKSSTEKLRLLSWVFVGGGSGPPAGGSVRRTISS
jgi:hypothetical protein